MKTNFKHSLKKGKANGKDSWILSVHYDGLRKRKYFQTFVEAKNFDVVEWLGKQKKTEVCGDDTLMAAAVREYLLDYSRRYPGAETQQIRQRLLQLERWHSGKVGAIDLEEIGRTISRQRCKTGRNKGAFWGPTTRNNMRNMTQIFLNWCSFMGYAPKRQWKIAHLASKQKPRVIGILSSEEAEGLLNEIGESHRPALAIMLYSGIRPNGEMSKLKYSDIKHGKWIDVRDEVAKTPEGRLLTELPEKIWSFIPKKKHGFVLSSWSGLNQSRRRACRRLGIEYPDDAARHSFGTYGYWLKGLEWTMHTMGHTSLATFQRHYRNKKVTRAMAEEYFSI
jgi:hypothetical protein